MARCVFWLDAAIWSFSGEKRCISPQVAYFLRLSDQKARRSDAQALWLGPELCAQIT